MSLKKLFFSFLAAQSALGISSNSAAIESGDWLIRSRFITVHPDDHSNTVTSNKSILPHSGADIDEAYTLEADVTYMIAKHWGMELSVNSSSKHSLNAKKPAFASIVQGRMGETRFLPSALVLQYHLVPDATIRPYAGLGAHYALFFDEKASSSLDADLAGVSEFEFDDTVGLVAQVGADYSIDNDWFFNIDFKYLNLDTTANFTSIWTLIRGLSVLAWADVFNPLNNHSF